MAASSKCFEDHKYLKVCLIQPLDGVREIGGRSKRRSWFPVRRGTDKVGSRKFFLFLFFGLYFMK